MTYKCMNGLALPYLFKLFNKREELHNWDTKNRELLHIPLCKIASGQRSYRYRAVGLWNSLNDELKHLSLGNFKKKLKRNMIDHNYIS